MYINKLFLKEFGKFNNKEIKLDKGLNVLYGEPGAGKSTIRDFVSGILYGMNKTKGLGARGDNFALRKPSGGNGYAGKAQVTNAGKSHLMERNFNMSTDGATLTDIESGKDERLVSKNSYRGRRLEVQLYRSSKVQQWSGDKVYHHRGQCGGIYSSSKWL